MKTYALKFLIFTISIIVCSFVFIVVGKEIIVHVVMMVKDVSDKTLVSQDSGVGMIAAYALIPEVVFGSISGWYLADWLCHKIWDY